jgi:hypothetical protein
VRHEYGLEVAQVILGHAKADRTQVYAEKNPSIASSIALKIGSYFVSRRTGLIDD